MSSMGEQYIDTAHMCVMCRTLDTQVPCVGWTANKLYKTFTCCSSVLWCLTAFCTGYDSNITGGYVITMSMRVEV